MKVFITLYWYSFKLNFIVIINNALKFLPVNITAYISTPLVLFYWSPLIINLALHFINYPTLLNLYTYTHIQLSI